MGAFFKWDEEEQRLHFARRYVATPTTTLRASRESDRTRVEEVEGWKWFDKPQDAITHFGAPTLAQFRRAHAVHVLTEQGYDFQEEYRARFLEEES